MLQFVLTAIVSIALIYIYKKYKIDQEESFILKLIGYYLLGAFRFNFNKIAIPIGFIIYIFLFRPKTNIGAKRIAASLGVFIFFLSIVSPYFQEAYFERIRKISISSHNIETIDLRSDFSSIKQKLHVTGDIKINSLNIYFDGYGNITSLRLSLIENNNGKVSMCNINTSDDKNNYEIKPLKIDNRGQYDRLIDEEEFLSLFEKLNFRKIQTEINYPKYLIKFEGTYVKWGVESWDNYLVTGNAIEKLSSKDIPIRGYAFQLYSDNSNDPNSFRGAYNRAYIFSDER